MLTTLADALPRAEFVEFHSRVIPVPPEQVWQAVHQTRWIDLWFTAPLFVVRGLGGLSTRCLVDGGPARILYTEAGRYLAAGRIAKPWHAVPVMGPDVDTLDDLAAHQAPSWLKYGIDFRLHPLPGNRTRLETSTRCEPTDEVARRRFSAYWKVIRPFSGLIRLDMLRAIARRAGRVPDDGGRLGPPR